MYLPGHAVWRQPCFYRDQFGEIKSKLFLWEADSLSPYAASTAPLRANSYFTGWMLSVSELDSITGIAKIINGNVVSSKKGAFSFYDLPVISNKPEASTADDGGWPPAWWPWDEIKCYKFPKINHGGDFWQDFWSSVRTFFASNVWDTEGGEHVSFPPFTFFFGNGYVNPGDGYVTPGGSSVFDQQFLNQSSTCTFIRQYIESIGEIPAGYSQADLRYCQLISDLGLDAASSRCLFAQYGSSFIDNFYAHWEQSDKSIATAELLKKYFSARCGSSPSVLFADIIKQQFCLHGSSMDIWLELMNQCGTDEQSFEQGLGVDPNLSGCIQELVKNNRKNFFQAYGINLSDGQLGNLMDICEYNDILNESSMPCFAQQLQAFNNKYGVNLLDEETVEIALDCFRSNPGCGGVAFEGCVLKKAKVDYFYDLPPEGEPPITNVKTALDNCFGTSCSNCTYSVTLYLEQPVPGTTTLYVEDDDAPPGGGSSNNKHNSGHAFIELSQTSSAGEVTKKGIGWYPAGDVGTFGTLEPHGFFFCENSNSVYNIKVSWLLSETNFSNLRNHLNNIWPKYSAGGNNCVTTVVAALKKAGIGIELTTSHRPFIGLIKGSPGHLGEDLRWNPLGGNFESWPTHQSYTPQPCH